MNPTLPPSWVGKPRAIRIAFADEELDRLQERLADAELPDEEAVQAAGWNYGTHLAKLRQMVTSWSQGNPAGSSPFADPSSSFGGGGGGGPGVKRWWRSVERRINRHQHYVVDLEGVTLHYQMARSSDPNAIPLVFCHGWPGSFFEADLLLDRLSKPTSKGGASFHVVVPSLVGYGLSSQPPRQGWKLEDTAKLFDALMTQVLGFKRYVAQGGDWGSAVARLLGQYDSCAAVHTNFHVPTVPFWALPAMLFMRTGKPETAVSLASWLYSGRDLQVLRRAGEYLTIGSGYFAIQSTKPTTIGYALYDNPVGILSYLLEKFREWSDPDAPAFAKPGQGETSSGINDENILINATWYYLSRSIHTSVLTYKESTDIFDRLAYDRSLTAAGARKPYGHSSFPYEIAGGPKSWIPKSNVNLQFYKVHSYGGHFAALDAPDALASDLREFFGKQFYARGGRGK